MKAAALYVKLRLTDNNFLSGGHNPCVISLTSSSARRSARACSCPARRACAPPRRPPPAERSSCRSAIPTRPARGYRYGQDKAASEKAADPDWLAHRSAKSWPGRLRLKGLSGTTADHRGTNWYFAAASGATTEHLTQAQAKTYNIAAEDGSALTGTEYLKPQLDIFDEIEGSVDFVTVTIGGNDVGFESILTSAALKSEDELALVLDEIQWRYRSTIRDKIKSAYFAIADRAGEQAAIIVAGYPTLVGVVEDGSGVFPAGKAALLNKSAVWFNAELEQLVEECREEGLDIWFASVEDLFNGHEAGTADAHINGFIFGAQAQDLNRQTLVSSYSMHPNESGAADYASAVQEVLSMLDRSDRPARPTRPAAPAKPQVALTAQKLTVDGQERSAEIYNIDGSNFFKLRDMAALLNGTGSQFSVAYDAERGEIAVRTGEAYAPVGGELALGADKSASAVPSSQKLTVDGSAVELVAYNIGGNNFFKLRELGEKLGFSVDYDASTATMLVASR